MKSVLFPKWVGLELWIEIYCHWLNLNSMYLSVDRNLPYQQNLAVLDLAVLVLVARSNRLEDLQPLAPMILAAIPIVLKGEAMTIALS